MKTNLSANLRPKRLAALLGSVGFGFSLSFGLSLSSGIVHAQDQAWTENRGKMVDRSKVSTLPPPASSEHESPAFDGLAPSSLGNAERRLMLEAATPQGEARQATVLEDRLGGANFESGRAVLLPAAKTAIDNVLARLNGKRNIHFEIVGHTDNQRIAATLRPVYPTNQALSEARALAVAAYIKARLQLPPDAFAVRGKGETEPVASNATPQGMASNRRTVIRVWFEEPAIALPAPQPVEKLVSVDACTPNAGGANGGLPFSISVDGMPLDADSKQTEADRQRCVDVALEKTAVQIKYDPLNVSPALNVWTVPTAAARTKPVEFATYTNYAWWQRKAEVRVFIKGQATQETPFAIVPVGIGGNVAWLAPENAPSELTYLLRVYDEKGRFDETAVKSLRLLDRLEATAEQERLDFKKRTDSDKLVGWGESSLRLKNIQASGGTVSISGDKVAPGQIVTAMGMQVPVDAKGKFAMRQILPAGPHSVEVGIKDANGVGAEFRRNLNIADKDWFYVAVADITLGRDKTTGPAQLVTADDQHYNNATWVDGRGAFYLKGKIKGDYLLTASADTQDQPLKNLFSNFSSKDPNYLLRRIDPNKFYPVYGDDSSIVDDAPTQGKFFVKLEKAGSSVMWGNFQTSWTGTELTQYSRGLYGANLLWQSEDSTKYGERNTGVNAFAAEPGTLQSREEFRGTGGSLYYLHQQDLTEGSERLWVEIRDKDSGLVIQRNALTPAQDYEINYLQGRLTLRAPLPSVADGSDLVQTSTLNGNPVYLVTTYEYVPGMSAVTGNALGIRASQWVTDGVRVGMTMYRQGQNGADQKLEGLDATLRYAPGTWIKGEAARSSGIGSTNLTSFTGGFNFSQNIISGAPANAERLDGAVDLAELIDGVRGRLTAYWQQRQAGFSGPGQITANGEAMHQNGVAAVLPVSDRTEVAVKVDDRVQTSQSARSAETAVRHKIDAEWGVSAGLRYDERDNALNTAGTIYNASSLLIQTGGRSDVIFRVDYRPLAEGEREKADLMASATVTPVDNSSTTTLISMPAGTQVVVADGSATPPASPSVSSTTGSTPAAMSNGSGSAGPGATAVPANSSGGMVTAPGPASTLVPGASYNGGQQTAGAPRTPIDPTTAAGIAAARLPGLRYENWDAYGFTQRTLARSGSRTENDRLGIGGTRQITDRFRVGAEASGGSGGLGGRLSGDYQVDDRSNLYMSYGMETEMQDANYAGRQSTLTTGSHYRLSDQVGLFGETRWVNGAGPQSLTHAFGVDLAPNEYWTYGVKYETGTLSDPIAGDMKRDAVGFTLTYKFEKIKWTSALEYRIDRSSTLGTVTGTCDSPATVGCTNGAANSDRKSWLLRNTLGYQIDPAWRLLGKLNYSRSVSSQGAFYDGDYTELVTGFAYRPVDNDRWNTLFKYTYFYNLPSSGQVDSVTGSALDYTQKSHVFNVDTTYDLWPWLSVGAKYGMRFGQLRDSKTTGDWFSSQADLMVLRADFHLVKEWDGVIEARKLRVKEADDSRSGYLVAVYRHLMDHMKVGVGYNFTNFSDDLTDLSYRSKGFFVNAISTF